MALLSLGKSNERPTWKIKKDGYLNCSAREGTKTKAEAIEDSSTKL